MPAAKRIFVPGFFCQFIVQICKKLNVSSIDLSVNSFDFANIAEFVQVYSNGAVIKCPSLLHGEIMISLEARAASIVVLMMATNPNLEYITSVFDSLAEGFPQCIFSEKRLRIFSDYEKIQEANR